MTKPVAEDWDQCPSGKFRQLSQQWAGRQRRRTMLQTAGAVGAGVVLLIAVAFVSRQDHTYADISCTRVQEFADDYGAGTLPPELRAQVDLHLGKCSYCQDRYREKGLLVDSGFFRFRELSSGRAGRAAFASFAHF